VSVSRRNPWRRVVVAWADALAVRDGRRHQPDVGRLGDRLVERLVRVRLRKANDDLHELEVALADLRRERRRRKAAAVAVVDATESLSASA